MVPEVGVASRQERPTATRTWLGLQERLGAVLGEDAGRLLEVTRRVAALTRDPAHRAAALR